MNTTFEVNAKIIKLDGISGHADQTGLIRWLKGFENKPEKIFLVHGEPDVLPLFEQKVKEELGWDAYAPFYTDVFDLITGQQLYVAPKTVKAKPRLQTGVSKVYAALLKAVERLTQLVKKAGGYPNDDLKQATKAIEDICDKLER